MAIASMAVNAVKVVLSDGDVSTPVVIDFDSRHDSGESIAVRFLGVGHMCEVTFAIVGGMLQMVTRNYRTVEDKPQLVKLAEFATQPAPPTSEVQP